MTKPPLGFIPNGGQFRIDADEIAEVHAELSKRQESFATKFDSVFIYLFGGLIYEFDMQLGEDHIYRIEDVPALADEAYHMVNG